MKKLIYLIVAIVVLGLIVPGCIPVVPPTEQDESGALPNKGPGDPGEVWNLTTNTEYTAIQLAIIAASDGDTISVGPGTYNEVLTINTPNLTIQSTAGAANTIIDAGGGASVVFITANGVTFTGFTLQNASGFNVRGINMSAGPISGCNISNITIKDLTTTGDVYGLYVIKVNSSTFSNISISAFTHTGTAGGAYGIGLNTSDNNTFTNITISNFTSDKDAQGVLLNNNNDGNSFTNTVISSLTSHSGDACGITVWKKPTEASSNNNTFTTTTISNLSGVSSVYGIQNRATAGVHTGNKFSDTHISGLTSTGNDFTCGIYNEYTKDTECIDTDISDLNSAVVIGFNNNHATNLLISGGEIQDILATTFNAGINILGSTSSVTITGMTISGAKLGIRISASADASQVSAHLNNIAGNTEYGVLNEGTNIANATCNWWGHNSGPGGEGPGTGDAVSANVVYNPWVGLPLSLVYTATLPQPATSVILEATVSDCTNGISGVEVHFYLDNKEVGSAITDSNGVARFTMSYEAGVYEAYAQVNGLISETKYLVVYDPSAGFVTGGGWIDSPAGAYTTDPTLIGKATFGFVSKYQKGANVPTGQTEFQFKVANFNFKSTSYDWMVVAGAKAMYKGTGTINGTGDYGFMLSAIDGQISGGGGVDKFRIKIWDKGTDTVIYDNKQDGEDGTEIGGGQIVIHKGK